MMKTIIKGTTPTFTYVLPFAASTVSSCWFSFVQDTHEYHKVLANCTTSGNNISTKLSQTETLSFDTGGILRVQLRVLVGTDAMATTETCFKIGDILKEGELS